MIVLWILSRYGMLDVGFAKSVAFSLFVAAFVLPVTLYFLFLISRTEPVLSIYEDRIELRSVMFPWRRASIPRSEILDVRANWTPMESRSELIFYMASERFDLWKESRIWHRKNESDKSLVFEFSNTTATPTVVVGLLQEVEDKRATKGDA